MKVWVEQKNHMIHAYILVLIRDAYIDANPGNNELRNWLDEALTKFDEILLKR